MNKYIEVFRLSFKMQIAWRFDVAMTVVSTAAGLIAAYILWGAVFSGTEQIGGFTFGAMLSYYIVSSIIRTIDFSQQISYEVSGLIRNGRFSGHMVVPMNPMGFFYSMSAGKSAFHLGFSALAAIACSLIFRTDIFHIKLAFTGNLLCILIALAMIPAGLAFMAAYHYFIGMLTFKFLEIDFFLHFQETIIAFATGAMIPHSLLPDYILRILNMLPFTHVVFTPSMLLTGRMGAPEGLYGLSVLLVWMAAAVIGAHLTYNRLRVVYDGVGI